MPWTTHFSFKIWRYRRPLREEEEERQKLEIMGVFVKKETETDDKSLDLSEVLKSESWKITTPLMGEGSKISNSCNVIQNSSS